MKLFICLLVIFHHSESIVYGPKIQISQGELQGTIEDSIIGERYVAFKGIPYATPPVGNLRFSDPLPAGPWNGTLNATQYSNECPQPSLISEQFYGNEDCLYLNIYTPVNFNRSDLPPKSVMFWIPGFVLNAGSGDDLYFGPDYLVAKDVIVVTINYRVGVLGFLNLYDEVASGNQGLKDQVVALKWVRDNIANFGGNPDSVTIFGASVGAASVHYLALSSMADGLYHKVIAQSGTALSPWVHIGYGPRINAELLPAELRNSTIDPKELVKFLRTIEPKQIAAVIKLLNMANPDKRLYFVPTVDNMSKNPFMPVPLATAAEKGVKVPFLIGDVSDGDMRSLRPMTEERWNMYNETLWRAGTPGVSKMLRNKGISFEKIREFYFGDKDVGPATIKNYLRMQTDLQYTYGIHDTVAIQASKQYPTYMYRFSYDSGNSFYLAAYGLEMKGVPHHEDLNYIFYCKLATYRGIRAPAQGTTAQLVVDRVTQMWTDFAKTGDPTPANTTLVPIKWTPVQNADTFNVMDISANLTMIMVENINNRNSTEIQ